MYLKYSVFDKLTYQELHLGCGSYLIFESIIKISIFELKKNPDLNLSKETHLAFFS